MDLTTEEKRVLIHNSFCDDSYLKVSNIFIRKYGILEASYLAVILKIDADFNQMSEESKLENIHPDAKKARLLILDYWFPCSDKYIESILGLSKKQQKKIRDLLIKDDIIFCVKEGLPYRRYIKPNHKKITEILVGRII